MVHITYSVQACVFSFQNSVNYYVSQIERLSAELETCKSLNRSREAELIAELNGKNFYDTCIHWQKHSQKYGAHFIGSITAIFILIFPYFDFH